MAQEDNTAGALVVSSTVERHNSPVYTSDGMAAELCQAEIVSHVAQYTYNPLANTVAETYHDYIIVMSQDCDMAQDFPKIQASENQDMNGVLVFEAMEIDRLFSDSNKTIPGWRRDRIQLNNDERFHFLERCASESDLIGEGFPPLVIDFKRYFTIPPEDFYRQCTSLHGAKRRSRLMAPYREHLQSRMAFYLQRVMLPLAHRKDPKSTQPAGAANPIIKGNEQGGKNASEPRVSDKTAGLK